ncbi:MAG: DNA polymerase III subunit gamma/tau [Dolichospermum sp.]
MSYEPLHHKYRPKSFAQLVGQEAIATTLTNAILSAKIAPAYLFTGPRGTGKTSSARILAKSLNCLQGNQPTPEPCGVCEICQGITKGYSTDVIEIDAASNTGVDNIRELIERAQFAPMQCRYKVYVIDECHMLSTAAFNALLKTLEEPPKHVVFVLATTDPQRVLPTIISRCQRFDFRRIQLESMVKHLTHIASQENINISHESLTLVGQIAQGGLRDAESLLDQLALVNGEVTPDKVWDLVGSVSEKDLLGLLEAISQDQAEIVLDFTRKILDRGREPLIILQNLAAFYRDFLIAKTAPSRQDLVTCTQSTWTSLVNFAQKFDTSTILLGQQHLRTAEVQLKNTTQPRLWLEVTLLGLLPSANIQIPTTNISQNISQRVNTTPVTEPPIYTPTNHNSPVNFPPPAPEPLPVPAPVQPVREDSQYDLTQLWQQVRGHIQQLPTQALLGQMCHLIEFDGSIARIGVKAVWYDKVKSYVPVITTAFRQAFQQEIQVTLEKATGANVKSTRRNPPGQNSPPVQPQPTPQPPQPPTVTPQPVSTVSTVPPAPVKTQPIVTNTGTTQAISSPAKVQPPPSNLDHDGVLKAAESLAKFFSGEIIRVTDDSFHLANSVTSTETHEIYESYVDDEYV